jgi:hypothetical protein
MSIQYLIFFAVIIFYVLRFVSNQKKQQEEARRRKNQLPPNASPEKVTAPETPNEPSQPRTIDEILKEMHRRVETQSKPYAKPVIQKQPVKKPSPVKEVPKQPGIQEKREPTPFLTEEYSAYKIEEAKVPANMAADFIRQGELGDVYNLPKKKPSLSNFNVRDAVVASIILNRLEW